ncbi:alanine aminotransferase 2-like [Oscarella lobularis]|uniref:alanine aminotransferase 2-like n=1 Tax=Oscarella lobularis TaxID=121494 RepID=UPI0033141D4C
MRSLLAWSRIVRASRRTMATGTKKEVIGIAQVNPNVIKAQYAVRGPILDTVNAVEKQLQQKDHGLSFSEVVKVNIGNPQALKQKPITFSRQVLAACAYNELSEKDVFPSDVVDRARMILNSCEGHSMGAYSDSKGIKVVRQHVVEFLEARDKHPADTEKIFMSNGASEGIRMVLELIATGEGKTRSGVMIPIPQYPLYTASLQELGMPAVPYYLDEDNGWKLDANDLYRNVKAARETCNPVMLVVINPGNPTGQILTEQNMKEIIKFCADENLVLLADEVYQENIYAPEKSFVSFKKALRDMGPDYENFQLISCHSTSKGFYGECGQRGGYLEVIGFPDDVMGQLLKLASVKLCPAVAGQIIADTIVKPPHVGGPSRDLYFKEKAAILDSLAERAHLVSKSLNEIEGVSCNPVEGSMYAFPRITMPEKAITAAKKVGLAPDALFCKEMVEQKGICTVPGSGFGQKEGTFHFRMTILPPLEQLQRIVVDIKDFHKEFSTRYA